jgi:hypothetical protein
MPTQDQKFLGELEVEHSINYLKFNGRLNTGGFFICIESGS